MKKTSPQIKNIMNEQLSISASYPLKARHYDYKHFSYPWHFHPEYEIIYVKESTGTRFVGDSIDRYGSGDVLLLGSNLPHYLSSDDCYMNPEESRRVKGTIIQFEQDFMYYSIRNYPHFLKIRKLLEESQHGIYFPEGGSETLIGLLESLPSKAGIDQIITLLQVLHELSEIPSRQVISSPGFERQTITESSRIDKIISYLNQHYTRLVPLEEIASFSAMNPSAFCRFFKSKTGKSFKHYILDMRIAYACKLLLMNDLPISKISSECGFDTLSHFNKCFRKNTGQSPTEYKRLMLNI
ncbi:AraC family transcriptional regulator [Pedobacter sp. GR22-6]|uniref:AraC family transcriptional regulator n=1 Tax=Pedobacter sp. GR22-6 TaxID=3127957 RepID=UPI00307CC8B8